MNAVGLLVIALAVFVFGYRYYAKLLTVTLFRPADNYSIRPPATTSASPTAADQYLRFGHHFAATGVLATLAGVGLAAGWGWTPAFLWVVAAGVIVGGVFGFGSIWLLRLPGGSASVLSPPGRALFWGLITAALLAGNAIFLWLITALLVHYPQTVIPFWLQMPIALLCGRFLVGRAHGALLGAGLLAVLAIAVCAWIGTQLPISIGGNLQLRFGDAHIELSATVLWSVLVFVYLFFAQRRRAPELAWPSGLLASLALIILMALVVLGLAVAHPDISAPNFHHVADAPSIWPLLFAVLPGGALAGIYLLVAAAGSAARAETATDMRALGYGAALFDAALGVIALLACTVVLGSDHDWLTRYAAGPGSLIPPAALAVAIDALARLVGELGIDLPFAQAWLASTLGLIGLVSIDAALRVQTAALTEMTPRAARWEPARVRQTLLALTLLLAIALQVFGLATVGGWAALGAIDLLAVALGLTLIGVALRDHGRPVWMVWLPAGFLAAMAAWALIDRASVWFERGNWIGVLGVALALLIALILVAVVMSERRQREAAA